MLHAHVSVREKQVLISIILFIFLFVCIKTELIVSTCHVRARLFLRNRIHVVFSRSFSFSLSLFSALSSIGTGITFFLRTYVLLLLCSCCWYCKNAFYVLEPFVFPHSLAHCANLLCYCVRYISLLLICWAVNGNKN